MKKSIKIFLIIIVILAIVILVDTLQAKLLGNRPFIKVSENYDYGNVYKKDKGIFVYTYNFSNGENVTVFRWEKYAPPEELDLQTENISQYNLVFYQKTMIEAKQKEKIISKNEIKGVDYDVYAFEGHVAINLNSDSSELTENSISLRDALLQNKITMDEIIEKANKDLKENIITGDMYKDGGSMVYKYDNYTILKFHTIDGNRDVYIGGPDMTINDIDI